MIKPLSIAEVHFEIDAEIGHEGRNSSVYTARDLQLDATLAIKKVSKTAFNDIDEYFSEASLLYLSSHPNIVPIHYACQDADNVYLAMPYYPQGSLKNRISQSHLTVREIITFSTQILSGLHNVHSKGLIHFDVKPDNVLISPRGEALIADFGLAKQTSYSGRAGQDRIYGKMVPPEAFREAEFSRHFDIYQMGLTLYRMSMGDDAFYADYAQYMDNGNLDRLRFRHAVLNSQFPSRGQYPEQIPKRIIDTIHNCLQSDPEDRFQSALDVVNAFSEIDGNLLDWRYEVSNETRTWSKTTEGRLIRLTVTQGQEAVAIRTTPAGAERRIREYCVDAISRQQIKRFLRDY